MVKVISFGIFALVDVLKYSRIFSFVVANVVRIIDKDCVARLSFKHISELWSSECHSHQRQVCLFTNFF